MAAAIDLSDIPAVSTEELSVPMHYLISTGRGLAMLRGLSDADLRDVEAEIWSNDAIAPSSRLAVAVRFRSFIKAFDSRRMQQLLLERGFPLIAPALRSAASHRLNQKWGFNPQRFLSALLETAPETEPVAKTRLRVAELQPQQLAA